MSGTTPETVHGPSTAAELAGLVEASIGNVQRMLNEVALYLDRLTRHQDAPSAALTALDSVMSARAHLNDAQGLAHRMETGELF